ncbi:hypothetical protein JTE90_002053 [Oedothorax gibbosus]|uniref:Uncharacterized protein n=1 Tax=Oedothorax gibbosus TaxID=931172 RepID=A0AAV6UEJ8_9ARAC|nr:hypothetical protein JTE90_002053 [Oedothorax gibbosus]
MPPGFMPPGMPMGMAPMPRNPAMPPSTMSHTIHAPPKPLFPAAVAQEELRAARYNAQNIMNGMNIMGMPPDWSLRKQQFEKKSAAGKLNSVLTSEGHETAVLVNHEISIEKTDASVILVKKSVLPPRKKAKPIPSSVKEVVQHNLVQSNNNSDSLAPSSSSTCSSVALLDIDNMSTAPSTSGQSLIKRSLLDATYVVSNVLEDKTNDIEIISDCQSSKTQEVSSKKRAFEKFRNESSSQMLPEENVPKFGKNSVFPNNPLSAVGHESFKKLRLLERRFSPSKDFSLTPSQEAIMAHFNLSHMESQNNVSISASNSNKVSSSRAIIRPQTNVEVYKTAETSNSEKNLNEDSAVRNELSKKEYAEVSSKKSKSSVFEEESFVSQSIPCGQPLPNNPSDSTIKSKVAQPSVALAKRNIHQSVKRSTEEVPAQETVPLKASKFGRKKKLRSKDENTSRRPDIPISVVFVQYTAEQISKMVELLNHFHSEM